MLGLLLIYFIGKYFYKLAEEHDKSKWGFAILGVVSYYGGAFVGGIILGIGLELFSSTSIDDMSDILLGFLAIPFGLTGCIGLYFLLKNQWSKQPKMREDIIDDMMD